MRHCTYVQAGLWSATVKYGVESELRRPDVGASTGIIMMALGLGRGVRPKPPGTPQPHLGRR